MEAEITRLVINEIDLSALKEKVNMIEQHINAERISIPERLSIPILLSALNDAICSSVISF
ncbi:type IV pili glycosylation protein, partial [Francisella tularensis subsp. holarctica]|nr:type IV pili glycosylation protein [Francisella tularensis subsp. holarctica]